MEKEFIPYELALELKELGFDEPCFGYWSNWAVQEPFLLTCELGKEIESASINRKNILFKAPTFSQAFRFFREVHKLSCSIELTDNSRHYYFDFTIYDSKNREYNDEDCFDFCRRTYDNRKYGKHEEAELGCLKKLIEIVKEK